MSIEQQYDAWVQGLVGGKRSTAGESEDARSSLEQMQAQLDALAAGQKRQTRGRQSAGRRAESRGRDRRKRAPHEQRTDQQPAQRRAFDSAQAQPPAAAAAPDRARAGFDGLAARVRARVIGQDEFVADVVKAFRRPFVMGAPGAGQSARADAPVRPARHRPPLHAALRGRRACRARHPAQRRGRNAGPFALPGPAQEKLFLQDLYSALQSDAEVLAFDNYEACAPGFRNMLATLAAEGTLALANRYVLQRGILVDVGTALAPGAVGELQGRGQILRVLLRQRRGTRWPRRSARALWTRWPGISAAPRPSRPKALPPLRRAG